ncbi:MAG: leucine-rich repeat domain-containing protein [Eubacteriales bacterium]|nr:leucine-rich repeat domain-containing protein [Eubacteriales bacterium]
MSKGLHSGLRGKKKISMTTWLCVLLAAALAFSPCCARVALAEDEFPQYGDFSFDEENGRIVKYLGDATDVVIPEELNGTPVVSIGAEAFSYNDISSIVFPESLKIIESWSISNCGIRKVSLPGGLERIEDGAFYGNELTELEIPASVQKVGYQAFAGNLLKTLTFGGVEEATSSLTLIDGSAFSDNELTDLVLPASLQVLGDYAFRNNQLQSVEFKSDYPYTLLDIKGSAFESNQLTSLYLPDSVRYIEYDAFRDNQLTEVHFPRFLSGLGSGAFQDNDLKVVELPGLIAGRKDEAKEDILGDVFDTTVEANQTELSQEEFLRLAEEQVLAGTHHTGQKISRTEANPERDFAFDKETGTITKYIGEPGEVVIPDTIQGVQVVALGPDVFSSMNITAVSLPEGLREIGDSAFAYNSISSIDLPESLIKIGDWAFSVNDFSNINFPDGLKHLGDGSFYGNQIYSLEIPSSVQRIGYQAFANNCLRSVVFLGGAQLSESAPVVNIEPSESTNNDTEESPVGLISVLGRSEEKEDQDKEAAPQPTVSGQGCALTLIDGSAFSDNELLAIVIPASVETIASYAFYNNLLGYLEFASEYPYSFLDIEWSAFENNLLSSLSLPDSIRFIDESVFRNNRLTEVSFPRLLSGLRSDAFKDNRLTYVELPGLIAERKDASKEDVLGDVFDTTVEAERIDLNPEEFFQLAEQQQLAGTHHYGRKIQRTEPNPERDFAFDKETGTITKYIGEGEEVVIPAEIQGVPVRAIGDDVFSSQNISAVSLPEGLEEIGASAFEYNDLSAIDLPESLVTIGNWAFSSNDISTLELPESLKTIGEGSFYGNRLMSLRIPSGVESIGYQAFNNNRLRSLSFAENSQLAKLDSAAFSNNELLAVELPAGLQDLGDWVFQNNLIKTAPALPQGLIETGSDIFEDNLIE